MAIVKRPFVAVNIAMTADGKIAPDTRRFEPFGSERDQQHMMELRSQADAIMAGARTVSTGRVILGPGGKEYQRQRIENGLAEFNLRVIVSRTASISPKAYIFTQRFSPILLLTTKAAPSARLKKLSKVTDASFVSPGETLDFAAALKWLREKWGVKRLLCEGGGELNAPMFRGGFVDELHLTICPVIFGGRTAPTLADGEGIERLTESVKFKLKRRERFGDELYCVYHPARSTVAQRARVSILRKPRSGALP
jgi:5-amino-6-(5-phosphoribosylamino)uracil reductase